MRAYLCRKSERLRTFFGRGKAALLSTSIAIVLRSSAFSSVSMASDSRPAVFVVGNEAADVDSLVAAYTMAQLLESSEVLLSKWKKQEDTVFCSFLTPSI